METIDGGVEPTGVVGLDQILRGGLPCGHMYLLEGASGAGKTTLGLQFLMEGLRRGQRVLWCTLAETEKQLHAIARSHDWDLEGLEILNIAQELRASGMLDDEYTFFSPGDVELQDVMRSVGERVRRLRPGRMVFDPFSDVELLARDPLRFRRQLMQFRELFAETGTTALLIQEHALERSREPSGEGLMHGIIALYQTAPAYGKPRRRLRVHKMRGLDYREGFHDVALRSGGLVVYPRLTAEEHQLPEEGGVMRSGSAELDAMLGGGLDRGASLLVVGPSGAGKSTLCSQFALEQARQGDRAVIFLFDETSRAFLRRADGLAMPLRERIAQGLVTLVQVNPAEFSPGEFAHRVRHAVEDTGARLLAIDSLNGYMSGMPDEKHLAMHMHELLSYLALRNVATLLTLNQSGALGESGSEAGDITHMTDATLLLRYFEDSGAVRRAAAVLKRRCGPHEEAIRDLRIARGGVFFGAALQSLQGILTGQPDRVDPASQPEQE